MVARPRRPGDALRARRAARAAQHEIAREKAMPPASRRSQSPAARTGDSSKADASENSSRRGLRRVGITIMCLALSGAVIETFVPGGLAKYAKGDIPVADKEGYWTGVLPPHNVHPPWCEADYETTHYVAEFWNTITSIPLILIGFYGIWRHHRTIYGLETRFWFSFFAFVAVGAGSVLFHATLWRIGQVLDELPMVWGNSAFIYACITMNDKPGVKRDAIAAATMLVTAVITIFYLKNPDAHAPFLFAYGLGVLALVVLSFRMKALPKECPPLMEISLCSYFFGLLLWVCERTFCSVVQPFQLHAMWHLLAGFGTYTLNLYWIIQRWSFLQRKPVVCGPWAARYIAGTAKGMQLPQYRAD